MALLHFVPTDRGTRGQLAELCSKYSLAASLQRQERELLEEISTFESEYILDATPEVLTEYLRSKYLVAMAKLDESGVEYSEAPGRIDISRDYNRDVRDRSRPYYVPGIQVTFHIPVIGQVELFDCAPNVIYMREGPPEGRVHNSEVQLIYTVEHVHPETLQRRFDADLLRLNRVARDIAKNIDSWNTQVQHLIAARLQERVARIQVMKKGLRFPMRKRSNTETIPLVRQKILPPRVHGEPHLALQQYEEILSALQNAALTFERAPSAFSGMNEEHIRQHLLIVLNGMFEGGAGAEVFNASGKTDILIRVDGKTIFVAECKFWKGAKSLNKAVDQLLSYTSWRDTKTALIILNRQGNLTSILKAIPDVVKKHPAFVKEESYSSETGLRYILRNVNDPDRELLMTVLLFDVPSQA